MSTTKRINVFPLTFAIIFLMAAIAGGVQFYSQQAENVQMGTVTNVSVGFAGGTAETADVAVDTGAESLSASAGTRAVPEGGETVVLLQEGGRWTVPESASVKAFLHYPYTVGWVGLLGAGTIVFGIGLLLQAANRRELERDTAQPESEQPAVELEETTSASTQTS